MDKTLQSLHILAFIDSLIIQFIESLAEVNDRNNGNSMIYVGVKNEILINATAFLDEWERGLVKMTEDKDRDVLIALQEKAKPAIDRIKRWKDLKEYRNAILAHQFRKNYKQNNEIVFLGDFLPNWDLPDHISEIHLLAELIHKATLVITKPFIDQIEKSSEILYKPRPPRIPKEVNVQAEMKVIIKEIESIAKNQNN